MRTGDFSALSAALTDPFTGKPYAGNKIPSGSQCTSSQDCINPVATNLLNYIPAPNINVSAANFGSQANYLQQTPTPSDTNGFDLRVDRTITSKQSLLCAGAGNVLSAQSLTDSYLGTLNSFLPPDHDTEHNNNLMCRTTT